MKKSFMPESGIKNMGNDFKKTMNSFCHLEKGKPAKAKASKKSAGALGTNGFGKFV